ncbi:alpha/beta fold hydrolase [Actinacidiphila oryziradicis]|uniref:Alpha/beta fold hydrolase n=1 Tax=Actinacidiphila oryziradicis TaxID=2571141 RepID=A0A4U0SHN5_9ACTN|nr:alpha/beta fold hydrolase [Actinacidiphila oryziradicis]TKA09194.1 alpha/beta fold hydrolase [Actinacidiphila oryziradicis]
MERGAIVGWACGPVPAAAHCLGDVPVLYREIHGYRRAFRMAGSGPPLLLVHGLGDSSVTWSPILARLARQRTVIAPDLLGHGGSEQPRADYAVAAYACGMRDLLAVLGIDRVTVVGHSLGAGVAMQFAYQFPERCERLVIVGGGGIGPEVHPLLRLGAGPGAELGLPLATSAPVRSALRLLAPVLRRTGGLGLGRHDFDYVLDRYLALNSATARQAFLRTLRAGVDLRGQVVTMTDRGYLTAGLPTLIIWGAHDAVIPVAHAGLAHTTMPGSRVEIFEEAGHFPHHDAPERFVSVLEEFLETTSPQEYDADRWRHLLRAGSPGEPLYEEAAPPHPSSGS